MNEGRLSKQFEAACDIADAIDPCLSQEQRVQATRRMARRDPEVAMMLAVGLLHGLLRDVEERLPGSVPAMMRRLRGNIARMD